MTVSLPLDRLSYSLSLPLSAFTAAPVESISALQTRITSAAILPQGYIAQLVKMNITIILQDGSM
jgi:hypothetical protein